MSLDRNESDRWDPPITCIHGVPAEDRCGECWGTEDESGDLYTALDETCEVGGKEAKKRKRKEKKLENPDRV